jgi:hypothetical protein
MHIALMHRRAVFPLLEVGDASSRGTLPSIEAALSRLLSLTQLNLKDLGLASRVRDKGIDCAMLSKSKQLKFRLKFELVSKEALELMDESEASGEEFEDDFTLSSGSVSRSNSSSDISSVSRSKDKDFSDSESQYAQLPSRIGSIGSKSSACPQEVELAPEQDDQQQWLVSAELLVGDPPQFDKVFRRLCAKCSPPGHVASPQPRRYFAQDIAISLVCRLSDEGASQQSVM